MDHGDPNETIVSPGLVSKPVPVRVTVVPPDTGPAVGDMDVKVGAATQGESHLQNLHLLVGDMDVKVGAATA